MAIQPPQGILNIPNATLRVGKLAVDSTAGFDTVFNNVERNTILLEDSTEYTETKQWDLKMPNIFVATFEIKGVGSSFNFRNTSNGDATTGYTLTFSGTTLTLKYDNASLTTATIPDLDSVYRKVYVTFEKQHFTVTVDGTLVLTYKDTGTRTFPDGEYINFFAGGDGGFKNLKVVAGHLISDGTSNVSLYGGLAVTSNLEVGSSNLFVDTVNSRVGVGTTTPEATLHVSGNAYVSSNLEVGSSNLFVDTVNSRVGVGTDTPKESLDVVGNMHLTRVSNVSQIKVDSNVVTEYTGPHDRPLRKYPEVLTVDVPLSAPIDATSPFMGKSQSWGGYTTIFSSRFNTSGDFNAKRAYDGFLNTVDPWMSETGTYSTSDGSATSLDTFQSTNGSYITLSLPNKIRLSHICIYNRDSSIVKPPKDGIIWGSSDGGTTFTQIHTFSNLDPTRARKHTLHITSTTKYDTVVVQITAMTIINNYDEVAIQELELYGHEEGSGSLDTTLKSVYNVPATTGTQLEVYYDGQDYTQASDFTGTGGVVDKAGGDQDGTAGTGVTFDSTYKAFVFDGTTNGKITTSIINDIGDWVHSASVWVKVETGQVAATSAYISLLGTTDSAGTRIAFDYKEDESAIRLGINAAFVQWNSVIVPNQWHHITYTYKGGSISGENYNLYVDGKYVEYSTLQGTSTLTLAQNTTLSLGQSHLATNYFTGSIANFRLYSKALNAGQVQELYDYQKDYFLGSKSQVTLYKGHLGVGVTEPSGQLELAGDERIQEYPPGPMDGYETLIPGHGVFCAYASSYYSSSLKPYNAFNKITTSGTSPWISSGNPDTFDELTGLASTADSFEGTSGPWIKLKLPYNVKPKKVQMFMRTTSESSSARKPKSGIVYGLKDGTYHRITNFDFGSTDKDIPLEEVNLNTHDFYSEFVLQITSMYLTGISTDAIAIKGINYFGTPGPTTLDKGSLSLTRSLDVPRISRYDVDTETPRPEKLVVDFDTTVNSSPTDISGKGNHGVMLSGASYSTADKAFDFNATSDTADTDGPSGSDPWGSIETTLPQLSGAQEITFSGWFKLDAIGVFQILYLLGRVTRTQDNNHMHWFAVSENGTLRAVVSGGAHINVYYTNTVLVANRWYHISYSIPSGTTVARNDVKVYLDGVEQVSTSSTGSASAIDIGDTGDAKLYLGWQESSTNYFAGRVSNFKIYNAFLEPSEVKKLYKLGRTGRSMVISDTAVGIGKVPEAQLDVRGSLVVRGGNVMIRQDDIQVRLATDPGYLSQFSGGSIFIANPSTSGGYEHFIMNNSTTGSHQTTYFSFRRNNSQIGSILTSTGSTISFNTGSDYRLKENIVPMSNEGLVVINKLQPKTFNFKTNPGETVYGFIAHELQEHIPMAVSGEKDEMRGEEPMYQGVDASKIVPWLVKAIQELYEENQAEKAKNESLETQVSDLLARVTALENA